MGRRCKALPAVHWPALLGTGVYPLATFSIESTVSRGSPARRGCRPCRDTGGRRHREAVLRRIALAAPWAAAPRRRYLRATLRRLSRARRTVLAGRLRPRPLRRRQPVFDALRTAVPPRDRRCVGMVPEHPSAEVLLAAWSVVFAAWLLVVAVPHVTAGRRVPPGSSDPGERASDRRAARRQIRYGKADYWLAVLHRLHDQRADDLRV